MSRSSMSPVSRLVVGFENRASSLAALRWAIDAAHAGNAPLRVIHATDAGVTIRNGPSSAIAYRLGGPLWATVHSMVQGLGAPAGTETIVETGRPAEVLANHIDAGDIVVLGDRGRFRLGRDLRRVLESELDCTVLRVGESAAANAPSSMLTARPLGA